MGIRVQVRVVAGCSSALTSALVNSGFESDTPDLCVPVGLARALRLWPPSAFTSEEVETAGGAASVYVLDVEARVQLVIEGEVRRDVPCILIVNPHVDEVLLSDYLIDELGIVPISFRKGTWRHVSDPPSTVRKSAKPTYWR